MHFCGVLAHSGTIIANQRWKACGCDDTLIGAGWCMDWQIHHLLSMSSAPQQALQHHHTVPLLLNSTKCFVGALRTCCHHHTIAHYTWPESDNGHGLVWVLNQTYISCISDVSICNLKMISMENKMEHPLLNMNISKHLLLKVKVLTCNEKANRIQLMVKCNLMSQGPVSQISFLKGNLI